MTTAMRFESACCLCAILVAHGLAGDEVKKPGKRLLTVEDLWKVKRLGRPAISPDGKWVAVEVTTWDMDKNDSTSDIWLLSTDGKTQRQLTTFKGKNSEPTWSPDGKQVAFVTKRGESPQIHLISPDGGEARQLTKMPMAPSGLKWAPDGKTLFCIARTWPDTADDAGYEKREKEKKDSKVQAFVIDDALYRVWDNWIADGKRPVVFAVDPATGKHRNLFTHTRLHLPIYQPSASDYDISPDGKEIAFGAETTKEIGTDFNSDIYVMPIDKPAEPKNLTADNAANDFGPHFSPNGKRIAFHRQTTKFFYADRARIMVLERDTGKTSELTHKLDRSCRIGYWDRSSEGVRFTFEDRGYHRIGLTHISGRGGIHISSEGNTDLHPAECQKGNVSIFQRSNFAFPPQIWTHLIYDDGPHSHHRLEAAGIDPSTASDATVSPYADLYLEYDSSRRVTKEIVQGAGDSDTGGGLGTFTFTYTTSSNPDGFNSWKFKTVETLPDGNQNISYANASGQVMLEVFKEGANEWLTFYEYDSAGRLILQANPSAVTGYSESYADLLNNVSGNYQYLSDSTGLIRVFTYAGSTSPGVNMNTGGNVQGYLESEKVKRGETGTEVPQAAYLYYKRTAGGATVHPMAASTVFRNDDGTGGQTTIFSYSWFPGTTRIESMTTMRPVVSAAQNGPGAPDTEKTFFDIDGRAIWMRDGDNFIVRMKYDEATGAMTERIVDVDTSLTSDEPSGWTTPSGGGLHLVTTMEVDSLGRNTKLTLPAGNVTFTVYKDADHEVRVYAGWDSSTNTPTGPTMVSREDRPGSYFETLTMSAAPAVSAGRPTGTEAISNLETLSRSYVSIGGQVSHSDAYFNLTGLTYSTSTTLGTESTTGTDGNFYRTRFGYDDRGRQDRVESPTHTIYRMVFDGLGRTDSSWVGLDDTPTSGEWSPTNTAGTDLVKVSENVYDAGGVGDSNLTQTTQFVGLSGADRVTQFFPDWRNRTVAVKSGVQGSESADTQRPITYTDFDNLSQAISQEYYDGDGVTITDANNDGVPDKPSSTLRRARSESQYDDQGRVFRTHVFSVDQSNGTLSTNSLTSEFFFDHRGNLIKTSSPGDLVSKLQHDGAGRQVKSFTTDGGSDSGWSDADDVVGDAVFEQSENEYDANSNMIFITFKQRFHDETATGELGDVNTTPKARVSFVASYFDLADRLTDTVNVGTNGGSVYTRPSMVPARSDTELVTSYIYNSAGWVQDVISPRGITQRSEHDDLGRVVTSIQAYVDGTPSDNDDRTTRYTYDGNSNVLTVTADVLSTDQLTQYLYEVRQSTGSAVNSNDMQSAMRHPDKSTGLPSASEEERYTYNAAGQFVTRTDRNGNTHTYSYDLLGRTTGDAVTTLGSGVHGSIRRLEFSYDTAGRPFQFTSFDAATGGNLVNQVRQEYNGLSQLITEYQEHAGAVNTATSPKVQYAYSEMAGGANHSRLVSMTYPNGYVLNYNYGSGLDDSISRLSSISDSAATLEAYSYLGLGTVVKRAHPVPGVDLTYIKLASEAVGDAGDQYNGLDRFGRTVEQEWRNALDVALDEFHYTYDRDSNRTRHL